MSLEKVETIRKGFINVRELEACRMNGMGKRLRDVRGTALVKP